MSGFSEPLKNTFHFFAISTIFQELLIQIIETEAHEEKARDFKERVV